MSKDLFTFWFNNLPIRTLIDRNNTIWFVASDVHKCLDVSNPRSINNHIKSIQKGKRQALDCFSEEGVLALVRLVKNSTCPSFRRWFRRDVLPLMRQKQIALIHPQHNIGPNSFGRLYLSPDEFARFMNVPPNRVKNWIYKKHIPSFKIGKRRFINMAKFQSQVGRSS